MKFARAFVFAAFLVAGAASAKNAPDLVLLAKPISAKAIPQQQSAESDQIAYRVEFNVQRAVIGLVRRQKVSAIVFSHSRAAIMSAPALLLFHSSGAAPDTFEAVVARFIACPDDVRLPDGMTYSLKATGAASVSDGPTRECLVL